MHIKISKQASGFTLIELMVVVVIVAILATIAIPSYRQYVVRNAESQAQARMQQLEIELNRWRATALTYKGFMPRKVASNGDISYAYDATDNKTIYVPNGSTSANYRYKISLVDMSTNNSLVPTGTFAYSTAGSSWRMLAEPNDSLKNSNANIMMTTSTAVKCKSKDRTITTSSIDCGTGKEMW